MENITIHNVLSRGETKCYKRHFASSIQTMHVLHFNGKLNTVSK